VCNLYLGYSFFTDLIMSAAWTARQGEVGDLRSKSKDELLEILSRQEKLLSNK